MKDKPLVLKLSAAFVGVVLFLTFFSNTIYSMNLPGVVVGFPQTGTITSTFLGSGQVEFAEYVSLFSEGQGRIEFAARVGERVREGDALFSIEVDMSGLLERLENEQSRLEATAINLSRARGDLSFEEARLNRAAVDSAAPAEADFSRFEREIASLPAEIERAEASYETYQSLYELGIVTRVQVADAARRLNLLRESYVLINEDWARAIANAEEAERIFIEQQERAFEAEQTAARHRIQGLRYTIRLLEAEERNIHRALERLYEQITADGVATVYADYAGIVLEIPHGLQSGMIVGDNQIVMRVGMATHRYIIVAYFPERMGILPTGTSVTVDIPVLDSRDYRGIVQRSTAVGNLVRAEILLTSQAQISGGERAEVTVLQFSERLENSLPNAAIREDTMGYYILYVSQVRNTLLGYSHYANQMRVTLQRRGEQYTAVRMFGETHDPIVIQSDRRFSPGSRVRMVADQ